MNPIYIITFVDFGDSITSMVIKKFVRSKFDSRVCHKVDAYRKRVVNGEVLKLFDYTMFSGDTKRHYFMARLSPKQLKALRSFLPNGYKRTWDETIVFFDSLLTGDYIKSEGINMLSVDVRGELFDE